MDKKVEIENFLKLKYKNSGDFKVIDNKVYSKTSVSFLTLNGINEIQPIVAVFYLSTNSKPYTKGFKIGILLDV